MNTLCSLSLKIRDLPIKQDKFSSYPSDWQKYKGLMISGVNQGVRDKDTAIYCWWI